MLFRSDKVGRNIFGCTISSSIPTTNDPITGVTPEYIQVTASGFRTLKDAFIGKYAILNESTNKQEVTGNIDLLGQFTVTQAIRSNNAMHVGHNNALASVYFNVDGDAVFEANYSGTKHSFIISDNGIKASCQGNVIAEFTTSSLKVGVEFEAPTASIGSIKVGQGHIYNSASDGDDGVLGINV